MLTFASVREEIDCENSQSSQPTENKEESNEIPKKRTPIIKKCKDGREPYQRCKRCDSQLHNPNSGDHPLTTKETNMIYFDRFDVAEAWYVFASDNHGGQACPIYEIFGRLDRMRFRPSPMLRGYSDLNENARSIYNALCVKHGLEVPMETIILSNVEGIARLTGTDEHGNQWTQFAVDYMAEQVEGECCICGETLESGWLCLDGGEECCDDHVEFAD